MLIFLLLKLLVISDIKQGLGYRGTKGHRTWRNILRCVVEEFEAKVDGKAECCLSLSFPLRILSPKLGDVTVKCWIHGGYFYRGGHWFLYLSY
ncbi:hypothetical protein OIU79_008003 [Salix purpurea]|uniref:DUF7599 domain-containing protein n=1 Tax=Salix purpurea TaxID=77065 RepID=A0A9Q0THC2_SALPP|nr:hypothetical protein OIU79_008003 [Salix purpurea]